MEVLYLHGLDSFLQQDRREVLEQYARVQAPTFDYKQQKNTLFEQLCKQYNTVDAIVGSSAGGLIGYYLAQRLHKPCLLFNPALPFGEELPFKVHFDENYNQRLQVVIGLQDEVIAYEQTLDILLKDIRLSKEKNIVIHLIAQMKHSYDIDIFAKECEFFFKKG